jgi:hypothetical protein
VDPVLVRRRAEGRPAFVITRRWDAEHPLLPEGIEARPAAGPVLRGVDLRGGRVREHRCRGFAVAEQRQTSDVGTTEVAAGEMRHPQEGVLEWLFVHEEARQVREPLGQVVRVGDHGWLP